MTDDELDRSHWGGSGHASRLASFVKAKRASTPDDDETWKEGEVAPTLNAFDNGGDSRATVATVQEAPPDLAVRRLTPRECERLMGWPDDWTRWAADGSEVADSSRYRMCGNGVASPVAEWLGRCIVAAEQELNG